MKPLPFLLFCLLASCASVQPEAPVQSGHYTITSYRPNGSVDQVWHVSSFQQTEIPNTVTFSVNGETITVRGSYLIEEHLRP